MEGKIKYQTLVFDVALISSQSRNQLLLWRTCVTMYYMVTY